VTSDEIAYRGSDLLRVLLQEHVAAALDLSHFAIGQSVRRTNVGIDSAESFGHEGPEPLP